MRPDTPPPHSRKHYPLPPAARFPVPLPTSSGLVPAETCYSGTLCLDLPHRRPPPPPHSASPLPRFSAPPSPHSPPSPPGRGTLDPRGVGYTPTPARSFGLLCGSPSSLIRRPPFMLGRFALPHARGVRVPSYRRFPAPAAVPCPVLAGHFPLPHAPSAASVALPPGPRASPPRRFACFPAGVVRFNPRFPRHVPLNPCRPTPPRPAHVNITLSRPPRTLPGPPSD